jgi:hypothetical protein
MKKLLIIFALLSLNVTGQTINWVKYKHQSDIKIYITQNSFEANLAIFIVQYHHQSTTPGFWYYNNRNIHYQEAISVCIVKYKYQADYIVYFCDYRHQVRVTKPFEDLIEQFKTNN